MREISQEKLREVLKKHVAWLRDEECGERANLRSANLRSANLCSAKNAEYVLALTSIIPDGDIVGWKKASGGIVKLLIPSDAKRSNATGRKCRAEFAKVLELQNLDGTKYSDVLHSNYEPNFEYRVGEIVKPTKPYDENRWNECSTGIHFFITRAEAEEW